MRHFATSFSMSSFPFVHLRAHTTYSLLEGAMSIKAIMKKCAQYGMPAVGMADSNNLFGSLEFSMAAADAGVQPLIGVCLHFTDALEEGKVRTPAQQKGEQLLLMAQNEEGYTNLLALASKAYLAPVDGVVPLLSYVDLARHADGILCLTAGIYGGVGQRLLQNRATDAEELLGQLARVFEGRLYVELMRHGLPDEKQIEPAMLELALKFNLPIVATNDAYFFDADMYEAHDALLCIAEGRYVGESERRRLTPEHRFKSADEMKTLFADLPEALANSVEIAKRCAIMSPKRNPILPSFGGLDEEANMLRSRARAGLEERLRTHVFSENMDDDTRTAKQKEYSERLEFELDVIIRMQFPGYFLIVSDFITWSKEQDIPVGPGRGSGAGSLVAWALLITDLDPLRYGLLFERFLNPERVSMPDFDIDFCQDRRDEVIKYVQAKYGNARVAQIITFGKLQARAVLRDVGRVLQLPYGLVDRICKLVPANPANPVTLKEAIEIEPLLKAAIDEDEQVSHMVSIALKLEGLNRHASTHAAGVVIGDRPLQELVPMYCDARSSMPVVQYSMKYAESAGLVKFDFLGLKTLSVLQQAVKFVARKGVELDLLKLPEGDKTTYELLGAGDATGVFQLESQGMRDTLRKLKPDCIEDIIALVSLYRPGPMDNIPTYIKRKHGEEKPKYSHPALEEILKETYGVIIYQEQVMQIAQKLAGYSLGEADLLRRAMGKKIREEMEAQRGLFTSRAIERGVKENIAKEIFDLMAKFAEYGFNKSHAAAYALIAYQTAFLKANHPVEFIAASMNYEMHNPDKLAMFKEEAVRAGIRVLTPDINKSNAKFDVEQQPDGTLAVRYGLAALRNVGEQAMQIVVDERAQNGEFRDMFDFVERVDARVLNKRQLEHLVMAGAFDSLFANRKQLSLALEMLTNHAQSMQRDRDAQQESLFGAPEVAASMHRPAMPQGEDYRHMERLQQEFDAIGFYLSSHPVSEYADSLSRLGVIGSAFLAEKLGEKYAPVSIAGIVTAKKIRASNQGRFAFISLSDASGMVEVAVYDEKLLNSKNALLENGNLLLVRADGKADDGGVRLVARALEPLEEAIKKSSMVGTAPVSDVIKLAVHSPAQINQIKSLLGSPAPHGKKIELLLKIAEGKQARVRLPGMYQLAGADISQLENLCKVQEAVA